MEAFKGGFHPSHLYAVSGAVEVFVGFFGDTLFVFLVAERFGKCAFLLWEPLKDVIDRAIDKDELGLFGVAERISDGLKFGGKLGQWGDNGQGRPIRRKARCFGGKGLKGDRQLTIRKAGQDGLEIFA